MREREDVLPHRQPSTLAFGVWLAWRGGLAKASLGLAALGALASVGAVTAVGGGRAVTEVPVLASSALAWTAGVTLAFGASLRALRRDRDEGVVALLRARGIRAGAYVRGRVGGLAVLLAWAIGGATLVAGIAATAVAAKPLPALRASAGSLAYVLAFAFTLAPVTMAALGARTRTGGYLTLLAILVLPEVLAPWTSFLLPAGWHELTSIPAALVAVREGAIAPAAGIAHLGRALVGLSAVVAASLAVVFVRAMQSAADGADPEGPDRDRDVYGVSSRRGDRGERKA